MSSHPCARAQTCGGESSTDCRRDRSSAYLETPVMVRRSTEPLSTWIQIQVT